MQGGKCMRMGVVPSPGLVTRASPGVRPVPSPVQATQKRALCLVMAQKSQEQVHFSHATNPSTFSQGTGPYDIKMKTIGVCLWAVNFHFFPDFDVADGTVVQYSVDFPSHSFSFLLLCFTEQRCCVCSVFGCGFSSKNNPKKHQQSLLRQTQGASVK